jgi:hypothetical protein
MTLLLVSIGGALGCVVRYVFEYLVRRNHPTSRPWATVAANALGTGIAGYAAYRLIGTSDAQICTVVLSGFLWGIDHLFFRSRSTRDSPARASLGICGGPHHHYPTGLCRYVRPRNVTRPLTPPTSVGHSPTLVTTLCVRVHVGPPTPRFCDDVIVAFRPYILNILPRRFVGIESRRDPHS